MKLFQPSSMGVAWRSRGNVARNQMKQLAKKPTFANSHHQPSTDSSGMSQPWNGDSQPPMKKIEARKLTRIMFAYSARKNSANAAPEYSRSEEHTSELQSLMRISYAVFCLKKQTHKQKK